MTRTVTATQTVTATCRGCGATWDSANAHGVAARHHDATGHQVIVRTAASITYGVHREATLPLFDDLGEG